MADIDSLKRENEQLKTELAQLQKIVSGYENVLKLNEQELENGEEIIKMYENIVEFTRHEMRSITETAKAQEQTSQLSRSELMDAMGKIHDLEELNRRLREQKKQN